MLLLDYNGWEMRCLTLDHTAAALMETPLQAIRLRLERRVCDRCKRALRL